MNASRTPSARPTRARAKKETRGQRVIRFIETHCRVPEGKLVGLPMRLEAFQKRFIVAVFDNPNRATRRAYLSIARKNGKSALIAAIALAFVVGPEQVLNSQVVVGARSRDQAAIIFKLCVKILDLSPTLKGLAKATPSEKILTGLVSNVEFKSIAAEGKTAHGLSPLVAILDEVGQVRGPHDDFVEAIETAQGAYDAPILFAISTQARSDADMFSQWIDDAEASADPSIVSHVYAADIEADLGDKKAWRAANPALASFRSIDDVASQALRAQRMPAFENSFRNLTLNQRVTRHVTLVSPTVWKQCNGPVDLDLFRRVPVFGGLDLSRTTDLTAAVFVACDPDTGVWHVAAYYWTPEATLEDRAKRDRAPYLDWVRDGHMIATPGPAVEYSHVARDLVDITAGWNLEKLAFDRHRIDVLKRELELIEAELPLEPFGQGYVSMGPAVDTVEIEFLHRRIAHGSQPVLTMNARMAVVVQDSAGNRKLDKSISTGRIDGMVALVMALGVAMKPMEDDGNGDLGGWLAAAEARQQAA